LCIDCNRKKSDRYEDEYLVKDVSEHITEPSSENTIEFLLFITAFGNEFRNINNSNPTGKDYADSLTGGELTVAEIKAADFFCDLYTFFQNEKPIELSDKQFEALKLRWGFNDGIVYKIREIKKSLNMCIDEYLIAEKNLIQRLGFRMSNSKSVIKNWKKL
jgi:hypothetical protein